MPKYSLCTCDLLNICNWSHFTLCELKLPSQELLPSSTYVQLSGSGVTTFSSCVFSKWDAQKVVSGYHQYTVHYPYILVNGSVLTRASYCYCLKSLHVGIISHFGGQSHWRVSQSFCVVALCVYMYIRACIGWWIQIYKPTINLCMYICGLCVCVCVFLRSCEMLVCTWVFHSSRYFIPAISCWFCLVTVTLCCVVCHVLYMSFVTPQLYTNCVRTVHCLVYHPSCVAYTSGTV